MATVIRMPEVLAGASEAAIQSWLVSPGQSLEVGQPLAEIETEKAVVEYAAETSGTVLQLLAEAGVSLNVGDPIAVVGAEGEAVEDVAPAAPAAEPTPEPAVVEAATPAPAAAVASAPPAAPAPAPAAAVADSGERQFASPLVRRLARERGLDLSGVRGSGPGGRIVRRDLDALPAAVASAPPAAAPAPVPSAAPAEATEVPHTRMRKAIARRLTESKSTVPHFYLVADCRVDKLLALRAEANATSPVKLSVNDFVLKAAAAAFVDVPEANATWGEEAVTRYSTVDMSVAVAIDGGLVTPVLRSVEKATLTEIARSVADLAERARTGQLRQHELEGGSFSVSNLGMYGVTEFSAIINPPQSAILAVGRATQQPVVDDGALAVGTVMTVTLSADHRVLDGALAAQWLAAFVKHIENPLGMLV
ncbi:pyruvate dehydrogenase E2 component (dihydrolipoamide acetyltransferase) [Leifsonia sp. AK011]|uniref:dihydrolipoamide acetyltransferase family protein n=1 Tax=Leifsonia sp. AK011 TaxID=2723075 RepID=UPI0015C996F7|nr:dihydrolipoamide acetyltransferase family protein [Leifsonia sp. AK011]NYF09865.1 pyruvate dehydrogenase E2 component (dihydrolipoamide acetyltransferase) [Leifsonia sp. AK011]